MSRMGGTMAGVTQTHSANDFPNKYSLTLVYTRIFLPSALKTGTRTRLHSETYTQSGKESRILQVTFLVVIRK